MRAPKLTNEDWLNLERELCSRSLSDFVRQAWGVLEPGQPYQHGWHIDALCEHLEAVTSGDITRLLVNVPPGSMKALDENTPILTLDGWKRHADLSVGDYVYAPDGRPVRVVGCTPEVLEDSYEVRFDDGGSIVAGSAHEWVVERDYCDASTKWKRKRKEITVTTEEIVHGSRPDRIPVCKPIWQPSRDLLVDPYILGVWLGDGETVQGCIYVAEEDVGELGKLGEVTQIKKAAGSINQDFHRVRVDGLQTKLRMLGVLGDKHVPDNYLLASQEDRAALLQGLMDTDGTVDSGGACIFTNKNERLADAVFELACSLGGKPSKRSRYTTLNGKRYGPHYMVSFVLPEGIRAFRLDRKQNKARRSSNPRTFSRYIKSVKPVGKRVVKCIEVEGGMYLAGKSLVPTHNSMTAAVFWPAWEWGPKGLPNVRFIGASHEEGLATRDNRRMRHLVQSEWYQSLWPISLIGDQNAKTYFENDSTGWRQSCPVKSMTGKRGDRVLWDDPHSVESAISEAHRETTLRVFQETLPTRLNNPDKSAIVIIMQRLHERDVSGLILEEDYGYEHLCLPMEFEPDRRCVTSIGFQDPRTEEGELLFPERFPPEVVERDKKIMGEYAYSGQMQQRPAPRTGGFFAWENLEIVQDHPPLKRTLRYWDKAGTDDGGARTAGVKMGMTQDGQFIVLDVVKGQWSASKREPVIRQTAESDGRNVHVWVEQEPGSGGKESAESTVRNLAGFTVRAERATGDKVVRAEPYSVQVEAGNVKLLKGDWNREFIEEHKSFPVGRFKDQIDAAAGAFNKINRPSRAPLVGSYGFG